MAAMPLPCYQTITSHHGYYVYRPTMVTMKRNHTMATICTTQPSLQPVHIILAFLNPTPWLPYRNTTPGLPPHYTVDTVPPHCKKTLGYMPWLAYSTYNYTLHITVTLIGYACCRLREHERSDRDHRHIDLSSVLHPKAKNWLQYFVLTALSA